MDSVAQEDKPKGPGSAYNADGSLKGRAALAVELGKQGISLIPPGPGAPVIYTQHHKDEVLRRMAEGETLTTICAEEGMPGRTQVYIWCDEDGVFAERYRRARRAWAESRVDMAADAADLAHDKDSSMAGRVKAETYLKVAALYDPARFAPKQPGGGAVTVVINTNLADPPSAESAYVLDLKPEPVQEPCSLPKESGK